MFSVIQPQPWVGWLIWYLRCWYWIYLQYNLNTLFIMVFIITVEQPPVGWLSWSVFWKQSCDRLLKVHFWMEFFMLLQLTQFVLSYHHKYLCRGAKAASGWTTGSWRSEFMIKQPVLFPVIYFKALINFYKAKANPPGVHAKHNVWNTTSLPPKSNMRTRHVSFCMPPSGLN